MNKPVELTEQQKKEMRLQVIEDALKRAETEQLHFKQNWYINPKCQEWRTSCVNENESVQPYVEEIAENCTVCALGGMLLSYISKFNKLSFFDIGMNVHGACASINEGLNKIFSQEQLCMIESAFECYNRVDIYSEIDIYYHDIQNAIQFGQQYTDDKSRAIAILQNMKKNKGDFIPSSSEDVD